MRYLAAGIFGPGQGAKSEHTRLYVSDEQRSHGAKASGQIDAVISLRTLSFISPYKSNLRLFQVRS